MFEEGPLPTPPAPMISSTPPTERQPRVEDRPQEMRREERREEPREAEHEEREEREERREPEERAPREEGGQERRPQDHGQSHHQHSQHHHHGDRRGGRFQGDRGRDRGERDRGGERGGGERGRHNNGGKFQQRNWRRRGEDLPKETLKVSELFTKPEEELFAQARELGVENPESFKKRIDLIKIMLKKSAERNNLLLSEGYLEILPDGFGFLRRSEANYVSAPEDVYVSPSQIRRFNLQRSDLITGQTRPPKEKERYYALLKVDLIWDEDPDARTPLKSWDYLTACFPKDRLVLETVPTGIETRALDLLAPLGKGQRGLIVAPPRAGKTILLENIANSICKNHPEVHLIVLLIDERPEEVTNMRRAVKGEVVSSTFDEQPERHVQVAEMVIEKAKRLVEHKVDVVILLDSITRLARGHNAISRGRKKTMSGGMDSEALAKPKKFFGSARKVEEGGSLTIIATALIETGSRMDDLIYEEFKGTGNMEVTLDRGLAEARVFPAFAVDKSGTRNEELLYHPDEYKRICQLRKVLAEVPNQEAMELLIQRLKNTKTNAEFLLSLNSL